MEAERSAIAAEIHDGLLPYLYAAAAKLAAIRRSTHATSPDSRFDERLADAAEWIDRSREVARALMNGISYPPQALADPLAAAQAFLTQFAAAADLPSVQLPTEPSGAMPSPEVCWKWGNGPSPLADRLPRAAAIAVFRLTTEFVRNALRHAKASHIEISAVFSDGVATVQIQDDGCGFRLSEVDDSTAHGLALSRLRAEAGGIEMHLESCVESERASNPAAFAGTRVSLQIAVPTSGQPPEQVPPRRRPSHE